MSLSKHLKENTSVKIILREGREDRYIKQGWHEQAVSWANNHFDKEDRFLWAVRIIDYYEALKNAYNFFDELDRNEDTFKDMFEKMREIGKAGVEGEDKKVLKKAVNRLKKMRRDFPNTNSLRALSEMHDRLIRNVEDLEHFFSFEEQDDYMVKNDDKSHKTPSEVLEDSAQFERELRQKSDQHQYEDVPCDEEVITFGDGWRWCKIDKSSCREEGDAMGHCGNTASRKPNDRILSLRDPNNKPHATFIINDGVLGEMKGRHNEKPKKEHHKYIVELLLSDLVEGVKGGGYAPQENFKLSDLDQELRDEVLDKKPDIRVGIDLVQKKLDEGNEEEAIDIFNDLYSGGYYDSNSAVGFADGDAFKPVVYDISGSNTMEQLHDLSMMGIFPDELEILIDNLYYLSSDLTVRDIVRDSLDIFASELGIQMYDLGHKQQLKSFLISLNKDYKMMGSDLKNNLSSKFDNTLEVYLTYIKDNMIGRVESFFRNLIDQTDMELESWAKLKDKEFEIAEDILHWIPQVHPYGDDGEFGIVIEAWDEDEIEYQMRDDVFMRIGDFINYTESPYESEIFNGLDEEDQKLIKSVPYEFSLDEGGNQGQWYGFRHYEDKEPTFYSYIVLNNLDDIFTFLLREGMIEEKPLVDASDKKKQIDMFKHKDKF